MKYALIVEWADTDTISTFFFDKKETAERERDAERAKGNIAHVYQQID